MSIDPSLPSPEPSDEGSNHADKNRALWNRARDLAGPLRVVFLDLKRAEASEPTAHEGPSIDMLDWIISLDELITANFTDCWDDDAAAWDKQALDSARQAAAELREGR